MLLGAYRLGTPQKTLSYLAVASTEYQNNNQLGMRIPHVNSLKKIKNVIPTLMDIVLHGQFQNYIDKNKSVTIDEIWSAKRRRHSEVNPNSSG